MVITGLLGAAAFNIPAISHWRTAIQVAAATATILFWLIDYRTSQYYRDELTKVKVFERALNEGARLLLPPAEKTWLRSSTATSLLFFLLLVGWIASLFARPPVPASSPLLTPASQSTPALSAPLSPAMSNTARPPSALASAAAPTYPASVSSAASSASMPPLPASSQAATRSKP